MHLVHCTFLLFQDWNECWFELSLLRMGDYSNTVATLSYYYFLSTAALLPPSRTLEFLYFQMAYLFSQRDATCLGRLTASSSEHLSYTMRLFLKSRDIHRGNVMTCPVPDLSSSLATFLSTRVRTLQVRKIRTGVKETVFPRNIIVNFIKRAEGYNFIVSFTSEGKKCFFRICSVLPALPCRRRILRIINRLPPGWVVSGFVIILLLSCEFYHRWDLRDVAIPASLTDPDL